MYGFRGVAQMTGAFAEITSTELQMGKLTMTFRKYTSTIFMPLLFLGFITAPTEAATNVYLAVGAPAILQASLVADVTNQYEATIGQGFFGDTKITISARKTLPPQAPAQCPCDLDKNLALLVATSTTTFLYGYRDGEEDERKRNLGTVSFYAVNCSSAPLFGASTETWNTGVCGKAIWAPYWDIYWQSFSSPTIISPR